MPLDLRDAILLGLRCQCCRQPIDETREHELSGGPRICGDCRTEEWLDREVPERDDDE